MTIRKDTDFELIPKVSRLKIGRLFLLLAIGLMSSFIVLVATGVPLKFHDWAISQWWVGVWGGIEVTREAHRFAAWVIVIVCLYHLVYLGYTILILKRPFPIKMLPTPQDFIKLFQEVGYYLGIRKEMPRYDRFNWKEKFDYWAIFWGMPVMAGAEADTGQEEPQA